LSTINSNEKYLIRLFCAGNEEAFEKIYHLYSKRLFGYFIKFVKSEIMAADLLQDAFIRIWNNRQNIDPEKSFRSYLFRIAENLVYDFFRKAARNKKLQAILINSYNHNYSHVEEDFSVKENGRLLQKAIDALPPKRRQVFQLVKIEECSYEEVSEIMHVSASTINDHVVKATKSIHENIKGSTTLISILLFVLIFSASL
jgi:RNA polymerase sigma-19 factor, ECF subfamily